MLPLEPGLDEEEAFDPELIDEEAEPLVDELPEEVPSEGLLSVFWELLLSWVESALLSVLALVEPAPGAVEPVLPGLPVFSPV